MARGQFARLLRSWRNRRGLTQQRLADGVGVSQRHISFLESGRSLPSPAMVERISDCLAIPESDRNPLLVAAGLAARHRDLGRSPVDQAALEAALRVVLDMHAPYPAIVMDRHWNVRLENAAAARVLGQLFPRGRGGPPPNAMELCFSPTMRSLVENWLELARMMLARLRRELAITDDEGLRALLARLERHPDVLALSAGEPEHDRAVSSLPVFPIRLRVGDTRVNLFSVITGIGTPPDALLDDLRLELYYPADEPTRRWMEAMSESGVARLLPAT